MFINIKSLKSKLLKKGSFSKAILFSFIISVVACFILQFFQLSHNIWAVTNWIVQNIGIFVLSFVFIFFLQLFLLSIIGNLYYSSTVTFIILVAIGYSNSKKISVLGEPLYPIDFYQIRNIKSLFEMIGGSVSLLHIIGILLLCGTFVYLYKKLPKMKVSIRLRVITFTLSIFVIYSYLHFSEGFINVLAAGAGVEVVLWNQPENYETNGFVFGLLSNLENNVMEEPEAYSEETINQIVEKYKLKANEYNKQRNVLTKGEKPNIIFVMDETFWDPTRLESLSFSEDPIKELYEIMSKHSSGLLLSPEFGGNTANVEFEALTGLSMYNLIPSSIPYQQSLSKESAFPSIVSLLEDKGYDTLAIHPYKKVFYSRDSVYSALGFNSFLGETDMKHISRLSKNAYVSDQAVVDEILDKLKSTDSPIFIHAVTMQNHLPIQTGRHGTNSINITGLDGELKEELETYSQGIKQSAIAMKNLTDALSELTEPTIVVFFGDHLPSFSTSVYEEAGFTKADPHESERLKSETPLFIYSNFSMEKRALNTMSPAFLGVTLLDMLEQPLSPYYAMLQDIKSRIPGLKLDVMVDSNNNIKMELTAEEKSLLEEYKLIQYDLLKGKKYSCPLMFNDSDMHQ
ncbi:LTA synthase family protein [Clostridium thermarum]|uniref:LTA synthase family protein n=1 Tax=Clostridium thermarum TaxID=1716543 RepID=UPI0013D86B69|nr:LTA synthase family protein [Clostridium thermarum]